MGNALHASHRTNLLLLNRPQQLRLQVDRQLADLVQKYRAPLGDRQQSVLGIGRAREGAAHVPEQFAFDQRGYQRSAVDGNERLVAEDAGEVNRLRHQLLARAAFAQNQHRMRALCGFPDDAVELFHLRRAPDDVAEPLPRFNGFPQHPVLRLQPQMSPHPLQQQTQFFHAEGFGDIVVRAIFHRLHRRLHRAVTRHHDHQRFRALLLDRVQRFQASRTPQVEQHGVCAGTVKQPASLFGGLRHLRVEAERLRHLAAGLADDAVIIHDQQVQEIRSLDLQGMAGAGAGTETTTEDGGRRCVEHSESPSRYKRAFYSATPSKAAGKSCCLGVETGRSGLAASNATSDAFSGVCA